jgi:DNA-binding NtrC family response regulator
VATVLVVDDADSIRLLCRINLEIDGHRVFEAGTLEAARKVLGREQVEVVLLDVQVGPADGRDLLTEIRESHPDIRTAMLTGSADSAAVQAAGPEAVITKPFELEDLKGIVNELAARGPREPRLSPS